MKGLNIILVDDNNTFRKGISFFLVNMLKHQVIAECDTGECFLELTNTSKADLILMDVEMPNLNGIETLKRHLWSNRDTKAIAVTNYEEKLYLTELIGAGFKGCVLKKNIYEELATAINEVINEKIYFPGNIKL